MTTYRAGMLQSQAYRALSNYLSEALKPYGITMAGWAALGTVRDRGQLRMSEVAEALGVKPPVATNMMHELEKQALVQRQPYEGDSRVTVLSLTEPGKDLVERVERSLRRDLREFLHDVSITDLATYLRVLQKLAAKL